MHYNWPLNQLQYVNFKYSATYLATVAIILFKLGLFLYHLFLVMCYVNQHQEE